MKNNVYVTVKGSISHEMMIGVVACHYLYKAVVLEKLLEECYSYRVVSIDIAISTDVEEKKFSLVNQHYKES